MEPLGSLSTCLEGAQAVCDELGTIDLERSAERDQLRFLEKQLSNVMAQLLGMIMDIEAGMSIGDLGFGADEFEEMVGDLEVEISNLKGRIRTLKMVCR